MTQHVRLTEDGLPVPAAARILSSPSEFDPGPHGAFHETTSQEYAEKFERPIWYELSDYAGGFVMGTPVLNEMERAMIVMVGLNPDKRTALFIYGRLKPGQVVRHMHMNSDGKEWDIDLYNDGSGYAWTIRQDPEHAAVGMAQRHPTTDGAMAAVIQHLVEEHDERGLRPLTQRRDGFTERARWVMHHAQEEARRLNHHVVDTEHVLLGLVREGAGVATKVLSDLGAEPEAVRNDVEQLLERGEHQPHGELPLTRRADYLLELAVDEAQRLNHRYIGTEHLLLGIVREGHGIANDVLARRGVTLEVARRTVVRTLTPHSEQPPG
jgi:Clp amino terminal domain, pathogenicity island component